MKNNIVTKDYLKYKFSDLRKLTRDLQKILLNGGSNHDNLMNFVYIVEQLRQFRDKLQHRKNPTWLE